MDLQLIERNGSRICLTQAGKALYGHAQKIFALEQIALADLRGRGNLERGSLIIGASRTVATYMLPSLIAKYMNLYPSIEIRIISDNTKAIEKHLLDCEVDLAFVEGIIENPQIKLTHWGEDELVIIAASDHPIFEEAHIGPASVNEQLWVVREIGSGTRKITEALLQKLGVVPSRVLEVGNNGAVVQSVAATHFLAMISLDAARDQLALGKVRIVNLVGGASLVRPLFHARLLQIPPSPAARALETIAFSNEKP